MLVVYTFILALFVSLVLVPPLARVAALLGMLDEPDSRKIHSGSIPRIGGIAIIIGALLPIALWVPDQISIQAYLIAALVIAAFGIWDDRANLHYHLKFLGQVVAALIVVLYGGVVIYRVPFFQDSVFPDYLAIPLTIFFIVGITNAINLSDGLDGLAGGTSLIAIASLGILAYLAGDQSTVLVTLAIAGATIGFLRYNTFPARVFMGDSGSQFLGFSAATLAVIVCDVPERVVSPVLPLLILGVPILDTLSVMFRRILDGRSPFSPDRYHIHHKLLDLGFSQYEAVLVIYLIHVFLAGAALLFAYSSDLLLLLLYFLVVLIIILLLRMARLKEWQPGKSDNVDSSITRVVEFFKMTGWLKKGPFNFLLLVVPLFLVLGAFSSEAVGFDFGVISLLMLLLYGLPFVLKARVSHILVFRLMAYVAVFFVVYLLETAVHEDPSLCQNCLHSAFAVIAVAVGIWVRFSDSRALKTNLMDVLIVAVAIIVPNLPGLGELQRMFSFILIESVIMLYAIEILLSRLEGRLHLLSIGIVAVLGVLMVRGIAF